MIRRAMAAKCNVVLTCGDTCQKPKGHPDSVSHGCVGRHNSPLSTKAPQLCEEHATRLLREIKAIGLGGFVSPSVKEMERRYREAEGGITRDTYDPVLGAVGNFMQNLEGLSGKFMPAGEFECVRLQIRCLLCFGQGLHDEYCPTGCGMQLEDWIAKAADEELKRAKALGLVPSSLGLLGHAPS